MSPAVLWLLIVMYNPPMGVGLSVVQTFSAAEDCAAARIELAKNIPHHLTRCFKTIKL